MVDKRMIYVLHIEYTIQRVGNRDERNLQGQAGETRRVRGRRAAGGVTKRKQKTYDELHPQRVPL